MAEPNECPRCRTARLSVLYYGADGEPLGGHIECTDCGPRHAVQLKPIESKSRNRLVDRKAS